MAVGRFQVMGVLQAARAFVLGLPLVSAHSWGLNRSIFYAAAKRGFKGGSGSGASGAPRGSSKGGDTFYLGDEMAYKKEKEGRLYFTIGGKVQTDDDFKKQIEARFKGSFGRAWSEALSHIRQFDKETLESGTEFYSRVYRPKRDEFADIWTDLSEQGTQRKKTATKRAR